MNNLFANILKKKKFILMAEVKLKLPSKGVIGKIEDIEEIAREYKQGEADVISVVVEERQFGGNLRMIKIIKEASNLPVFAKDFVTDEKQIKEIKKAGADAVLLLADLNSKENLKKLFEKAQELDLIPVVEVDNEKDLKTVVAEKYPVIAINARNLRDYSVDLKKARKLLQLIPKDRIALAFSGVRNKEDVQSYIDAGARGVLIGTTLMKAKNKAELLKEFRNI